MAERRCKQCWQWKAWPDAFVSPRSGRVIRLCADCVNHQRGIRKRPSRVRREQNNTLRVRVVKESKNKKHAGIPSTLTSASTCPPSCSFHGRGCYAEFHMMAMHWSKVPEFGLTWWEFLEWVRTLKHGQLWRHNDAGDLPGVGEWLDTVRLDELVLENYRAGARGFTFTHKRLDTEQRRQSIRWANLLGFTINLSADSLEQADELSELGIAPVAVVLPRDAERVSYTPAGRKVVVCPAQTSKSTCSKCQLCAQPERDFLVGFRAHGQAAKTVTKTVHLPVLPMEPFFE